MEIIEYLNDALYVKSVNIKIISVVILIIVLTILYKFIVYLSHKKIENLQFLYHLKKSLYYFNIIIGLVLSTIIIFDTGYKLLAFMGIFSAAVAIALREPIANFAGWFFIMWRKPFEVKDRIEIGCYSGDVIDQRMFQFTLLEIGKWVKGDQSTGRIIHIPNSMIFNTPLSNYNKWFKYIWDEISISITIDSDWKKARNVLKTIVNKNVSSISKEAKQEIKNASRHYLIFYNKLTPIVYMRLNVGSIEFNVRYLTEPKKRRVNSQKLYEDILVEFSKFDNINLK